MLAFDLKSVWMSLLPAIKQNPQLAQMLLPPPLTPSVIVRILANPYCGPGTVTQSHLLLPQKEANVGPSVLYLFEKAGHKDVPKVRLLEPLKWSTPALATTTKGHCMPCPSHGHGSQADLLNLLVLPQL